MLLFPLLGMWIPENDCGYWDVESWVEVASKGHIEDDASIFEIRQQQLKQLDTLNDVVFSSHGYR